MVPKKDRQDAQNKRDAKKRNTTCRTGREQIDEKIAALVKKAEKSGMPYSILKKVYDRGMLHIKLDTDQALLHNSGDLQE